MQSTLATALIDWRACIRESYALVTSVIGRTQRRVNGSFEPESDESELVDTSRSQLEVKPAAVETIETCRVDDEIFFIALQSEADPPSVVPAC